MKKTLTNTSPQQNKLILPLHTRMSILAIVEKICSDENMNDYRIIVGDNEAAIRLKDGGYYILMPTKYIGSRGTQSTRFGNTFIAWLKQEDELKDTISVAVNGQELQVEIISLSNHSTTDELRKFIRASAANI